MKTVTHRLVEFALLLALFGFGPAAHPFCVSYDPVPGTNISPAEFHLPGPDFRNFKAALKAGERTCCNWKNLDCNPSGKQDHLLSLRVFHFQYVRNEVGPYTVCIPEGFTTGCKTYTREFQNRYGNLCRALLPAGGSARYGVSPVPNSMNAVSWGITTYNVDGSKRETVPCATDQSPP
jgi:hypothetical protein